MMGSLWNGFDEEHFVVDPTGPTQQGGLRHPVSSLTWLRHTQFGMSRHVWPGYSQLRSLAVLRSCGQVRLGGGVLCGTQQSGGGGGGWPDACGAAVHVPTACRRQTKPFSHIWPSWRHGPSGQLLVLTKGLGFQHGGVLHHVS